MHSLALRAGGTVVAWADNTYGQANVPLGLTNVRAIAAGYYYSLALKTDGTVVSWGWNEYGETNVPAGLASVGAIAAGWHHSVAVTGAIVQPAVDFFLHGSGATANPLTLFLDRSAPTTATEKYKDSPGVNFNGGNPWAAAGVWSANAANSSGTLSALCPFQTWVGLRNGDDQGTRFDLRVEVYKNSALVSAGETYCIQNVTRNPASAVAVGCRSVRSCLCLSTARATSFPCGC
jgi:hypothetical protein